MQTTFPSTHYEQYGYDAVSNLTSKTDRKGQTINYVYDDLNRLTQKTYPDSTTVEYVYDLVGKLQQVTDPTGTYGFAYDNMGRLVGSTTKYTFLSTTTYSNSYTYDANSNRASMTDPQGGVTSYVYDTLNRLSTLTPPTAFGTGSFGFTYDALSRRTQMTRPNGVTTNYTYNNLSQLLSVLHQVGASTIDGAVYTVDPSGNRTAKIDKLANVTSNYTYDPLYELTQVTQSTTTTETYSYDPVGNRLSSLGVSPYSVNTSNELTSIPSTTYTYDSNGNTLTKVTSSGTTTFGWDYENRMTSVTLPGTGGTLTLKYDGLGRRVQKAFTQGSTTTTTNYLYDGNNAVADIDQNGNVLARYVATQNIDEPLAELRASTTSYYSQDGLGSVTSLTTSAGALANTYTYDSFGKLIASTGSTTNRFEYTAREFDSETGIYFYRARYFDPTVGRFIGEDPIRFRGGVNFYVYAWNSASNFSDPTGQFPPGLHGQQTYGLALDIFGPKCESVASIVAEADVSVDSFWGLLNPFGSAWQYGGPHFPRPGQADALVDDAIGGCNASNLGQALHTLQDGYAHPSGPLGPFVHMITGTMTDYSAGPQGAAALGATRAALQDFKDKCLSCCQGGSSTQLLAQ